MDNHEEVIAKWSIVDNKVDGIITRLDVMNGSVAKVEKGQRTLEDKELLRSRDEKNTKSVRTWALNNIMSIVTALIAGYLFLKFGL